MIVYVSYSVRLHEVWLRDPQDREELRQELLTHARRLHAARVRPGRRPAAEDVEVELVESIGGVPEDTPEAPAGGGGGGA